MHRQMGHLGLLLSIKFIIIIINSRRACAARVTVVGFVIVCVR